MADTIASEYMVFLEEGGEPVAAVREIRPAELVIYVENAGEFVVPERAVARVHDKKILLDRGALDRRLLDAFRHTHDSEDPRLAG